ncbi:Uncharacterised protein [Raoultella planticola]|uniref:Uncharacterized protein n=1 Tax=Raoultella planticola TaxID=575 RepID=A0A485CGT4_RAOPL|nr:Uncharacterised protein [Raoultella planticola]
MQRKPITIWGEHVPDIAIVDLGLPTKTVSR